MADKDHRPIAPALCTPLHNSSNNITHKARNDTNYSNKQGLKSDRHDTTTTTKAETRITIYT